MRTIALVVSMVLCSMLLLGCGKAVVPEGAEYNMFTSDMSSEEVGTITEVHDATLKALKNLELPISYDKKDNLVALVQTFTSTGESIKILIEYRNVDVTLLTLSSPDDVDEYKMTGLLEEIRRNMSII